MAEQIARVSVIGRVLGEVIGECFHGDELRIA